MDSVQKRRSTDINSYCWKCIRHAAYHSLCSLPSIHQQIAQLSQRDCAMRLLKSCQLLLNCSIKIPLKRFAISEVHSRSLETAQFDRPYIASRWSTLTTALSRNVPETLPLLHDCLWRWEVFKAVEVTGYLLISDLRLRLNISHINTCYISRGMWVRKVSDS